MPNPSPWNDTTDAILTQLWAEGHTTAEIGRRMGISKNAVVGKAHRLDLPSRKSPIENTGFWTTGRKLELHDIAPNMTIPQLMTHFNKTEVAIRSICKAVGARFIARPSGFSKPQVVYTKTPKLPPLQQFKPPTPVQPTFTAPPRPSGTGYQFRHAAACQWPHGEPGRPGFHFCGDKALPLKPYCQQHSDIAYVKVRDRREDAA